MNTLIKIGVGVAVVGVAVAVVPALKGPYYRLKTTVTEKLNDEFVVDNYKAEYVNLHGKKIEIEKNIQNFKCEMAVISNKRVFAEAQADSAKKMLLSTGTSDLAKFNKLKNEYEIIKTNIQNFNTTMAAYSNAVAKLEKSLVVVENNMQKAKLNVDTLSSKKALVDTIKGVNKTIENLNGIGENTDLNISIEKLDDNAIRESIKLEALAEKTLPASTTTEAEAKAYLESLK